MAKPKVLEQALTANRLHDGIAVFLTPDGRWSEYLSDAGVVVGRDEAQTWEERGLADERDNKVVGAYLIGVVRDGDSIRAAHIREAMRAKGPSVRPDLAKTSAEPVRQVA